MWTTTNDREHMLICSESYTWVAASSSSWVVSFLSFQALSDVCSLTSCCSDTCIILCLPARPGPPGVSFFILDILRSILWGRRPPLGEDLMKPGVKSGGKCPAAERPRASILWCLRPSATPTRMWGGWQTHQRKRQNINHIHTSYFIIFDFTYLFVLSVISVFVTVLMRVWHVQISISYLFAWNHTEN